MELVMPKLPEEIVADILSRQPVKILTRFKCVSKPWLSLISDPQFAKLQLKQARAAAAAAHNTTTTNHKRLLLASCSLRSMDFEAFSNASDPVFQEQDYPAKRAPGCIVGLVGTCDGLICLLFDYKDLILWNPSTRVSMELTAPDDHPDHQDTFFRGFGFGYDISSDGYKVIRVVSYIASNGLKETEVQVLTMKKNSWRKIQYADPSCVSIYGMGTLSNNALHWLRNQESENGLFYSIVSFDLSGERFEEVGIPDHIARNWCVNLVTMGESLVMFCNLGGNHFESWAMKRKSWTRLFRVSGNSFPGFEYQPSLVGFTKEGKVVLDIDGWELILYSPGEETFKDFIYKDDWGIFESIVYEESLVSPNDTGHDQPSRIQ